MVRSNSTGLTSEQLQCILLAMTTSRITVWVNLCLPQGYISYKLCRQTLKSAKHILLECELLGRRIREGEQTGGEEVDVSFGIMILELVKFQEVEL